MGRELRQIREAVHHLRKSAEDHPGDASALAAALHKAQAVGASPQERRRYEQMLKRWYDEQPFKLQISTLSTQQVLESSGASQLGDFKERVAKELGWKCTWTKLLLRGVHLDNESKCLYEYGISAQNNVLVAVHTGDVVEDAHRSMVERLSCVLAETNNMASVVPLLTLHVTDVPHSTRHHTLELIFEAAARGYQDILEAARFIMRVEDGELADEDVRRRVRANARSATGDLQPLADVDKKFLHEAKQRVTNASNEQEKFRTQACHAKQLLQERRAHADEIAAHARLWRSSTDITGRASAIPWVQ